MFLTKERLQAAIPEHDSVRQIAKLFGLSVKTVYQRVKEWGLSLDELKERSQDEHERPSPEEIATRAAEVRRSWSPAEARRRMGAGAPRRWSPPSYHCGELVGVAESIAVSRRRG